MRLRLLFVSAITIFVTACSHSPSGVLPSNGVYNQIIQGGQPPPNWEVFSVPDASVGDHMTIGPDGQIWIATNESVQRFDIAKGQITTFSGLNSDGEITAGDGDLWVCNSYSATKLTVSGQSSVYPISDYDCSNLVVGSDGALWYLGDHLMFGRVTADGVASHIPEPPNEQAWDLLAGPDGNIWFTENRFEREKPGYHAIAKIDITTHAITEYKKTLRSYGGLFDRLFADKNGNFYTDAEDQPGDVWRLTPTTATWKKFTLGLHTPLKPGDISGLYFGGSSGGVKWTFAGHKVVTYGLPPDSSGFPAYSALTAPDRNVWFTNGPKMSIFINRILSVSPVSATIGVGGMKTFTISESNCPQCIWSAVSSNTSIATVSPVSDGQFTVTGVAAGTATVTVSDKAQNAFDVQITVQ